MSINDAIKKTVREREEYLCEYCHSPERLSANRFTVNHVIPRSLEGSDEIGNLALACRRCNERRYNFVAGFDPETKEIVLIFSPRSQRWAEHFIWLNGGIMIQGVTPTGRATCKRLYLNDERYPKEDSIQATRELWIKTGIHPAKNDPCQI
jgi:HNH endonuclease